MSDTYIRISPYSKILTTPTFFYQFVLAGLNSAYDASCVDQLYDTCRQTLRTAKTPASVKKKKMAPNRSAEQFQGKVARAAAVQGEKKTLDKK